MNSYVVTGSNGASISGVMTREHYHASNVTELFH